MDKSVKQTNRPPGEFTKFIINKLRDSKQPLSASTLCMAVKDNLPSQFHPNKGEFNKWMKTLYNIETDNSNQDMPYYKFKITDFEIFDKYKIGDNSYVKVLLDKIKDEHIVWSKIYRMYNTTQHNQTTWDKLNTIFNSSTQNIKTFDEKFPDFSKTVDRFRINKMPNKPFQSPQNIRVQKQVLNQENKQIVQPKELNFKASLGLGPSLIGPPPGLLHPSQISSNQQTQQPSLESPALIRPSPEIHQSAPVQQQYKSAPVQQQYQSTPVQQQYKSTPVQQQYQSTPVQQQYQSTPVQQQYQSTPVQNKYESPPGLQQYQSIPGHQINLIHSLPPLPPPSNYSVTLDNKFESLLGLNFFEKNNMNEIIKQLSHSELLFLDKVHHTLKNTEGSALCKLIEEIGKVRNIVFS